MLDPHLCLNIGKNFGASRLNIGNMLDHNFHLNIKGPMARAWGAGDRVTGIGGREA